MFLQAHHVIWTSQILFLGKVQLFFSRLTAGPTYWPLVRDSNPDTPLIISNHVSHGLCASASPDACINIAENICSENDEIDQTLMFLNLEIQALPLTNLSEVATHPSYPRRPSHITFLTCFLCTCSSDHFDTIFNLPT